MKASVTNELTQYIADLKADRVLTDDNKDDWHDIAFNQDYYIIGYYQAEQWFNRHQISAWEAIEYVKVRQETDFGEVTLTPEQCCDPEYIVNLFVYFASWEVL